jgi:hypothetical protein
VILRGPSCRSLIRRSECEGGQEVDRVGELLAFIKRDEARASGFRLRAGWVETDEVFVQLLRVCDVVLLLFKLGGFEQFIRLVPAAGG